MRLHKQNAPTNHTGRAAREEIIAFAHQLCKFLTFLFSDAANNRYVYEFVA